MTRVLLTGATGFVGSAIALQLLGTDAHPVCLVRSRNQDSPQVRLEAALRTAAGAYGLALSTAQIARCRAIEGDITLPLGGVDPGELDGVTEIWHIAASLSFEDERADEISLHNEQGTKNIVELARKIDCPIFNYVSTAYVAGSLQGLIREAAVPDSAIANNQYERSKIAAERIVVGASFDVTCVFRPSVVIGHSGTYGTVTSTGMYGFTRGLQSAHAKVQPQLGELLRYRGLRLLADGDTPINLIPIDYVSRGAVTIANSRRSGVYHLANNTPPVISTCLNAVSDVLGLANPVCVDTRDEFTLVDERVADETIFFQPYMHGRKYFSTVNAEAVLGNGALSYPLDEETLKRYLSWFVERTS